MKANITAIWLRRIGDKAQVLAEIDGKWRQVIEESLDGSFSHIAEVVDDGTRWPVDPITDKTDPVQWTQREIDDHLAFCELPNDKCSSCASLLAWINGKGEKVSGL
jgi:hypothetical protein